LRTKSLYCRCPGFANCERSFLYRCLVEIQDSRPALLNLLPPKNEDDHGDLLIRPFPATGHPPSSDDRYSVPYRACNSLFRQRQRSSLEEGTTTTDRTCFDLAVDHLLNPQPHFFRSNTHTHTHTQYMANMLQPTSTADLLEDSTSLPFHEKRPLLRITTTTNRQLQQNVVVRGGSVTSGSTSTTGNGSSNGGGTGMNSGSTSATTTTGSTGTVNTNQGSVAGASNGVNTIAATGAGTVPAGGTNYLWAKPIRVP